MGTDIDNYLNADKDGREKMFREYLEQIRNPSLKPKTIKDKIHYMNDRVMLSQIKSVDSSVTEIYSIIDINTLQKIYNGLRDIDRKNRNRYHSVYSSTMGHYKDFIEKLESQESEETTESSAAETKEEYNRERFSISRIISLIKGTGLLYDDMIIKRFAFSLMSKPFVILSGLAGSGKTQLALAFSYALITDERQICVVSVGADWTNREPLLGFPNALQKGEYVKPENGVLDLLIEAQKEENMDKPYFLILDEMNMSYVERYFADFLSAMESHEFIPLWKDRSNEVPQSIKLPKNLFIIGTINVDETTYMFSPKVLDRANVIEFKISGGEMDSFLNGMKSVERDSMKYKGSDMGKDFLVCAGDKSLANDLSISKVLLDFFEELKKVNAEFGYRTATEIYRFIHQFKTNDDTEAKMEMEDIIDSAIVQKLLPKLHGSRRKLEPVLNTLWKKCFSKEMDTPSMSRESVQDAILKLTADKILRMYEAARDNGFTSFSEA